MSQQEPGLDAAAGAVRPSRAGHSVEPASVPESVTRPAVSGTPAPPSAVEALPGSKPRLVAGRYRLDALLGVGGSAQVWRATIVAGKGTGTGGGAATGGRRVSAPVVAVKLLHPYLVPDGTSRVRLLAEARAVRELRHPGIVQLRDVVVSSREIALVFDYVSGGSLAAALERGGRMAPHRAAALAAEIADALDYAHRRRIVHRDVTPGNVLLDAEGHGHLTDFGIARLVEEGAATVTATGTVLGTLRYMSPEQLAGATVDARSDVYSLGALLYEMLAGRAPFDARTPVGLVEQHAGPPPDLPADVPAPLAAIALAALRLEPRDRPQEASGVRDALRAWLAGEPVSAVWLRPSPAGATRTQALAAAGLAAARSAAAPFGGAAAAGRPPRGTLPRGTRPHPVAGSRPTRRQGRFALALAAGGLALAAGIALANVVPAQHESLGGPSATPGQAGHLAQKPSASPGPSAAETPAPAVVTTVATRPPASAPAPPPVAPHPARKPPAHHGHGHGHGGGGGGGSHG